MNTIHKIKPFSWKAILARHLILNHYRRSGESKQTIKNTENIISTLILSQYRVESILPNFLHLLDKTERTRKHHIIRLIDINNFKISAHIIPSNFEIPAHLHPSTISFTCLQKGDLAIKQSSLITSIEPYHCQLKENQVCAGLIKLRNIHRIKSLDKPCLFLSIRITKKTQNFIDSLRCNKKGLNHHSLLASAMFFFLPVLTSFNAVAAEDRNQVNKSSKVEISISDKQLLLANQLRKGEGVSQDFYKAVQLYKMASKKGNAEAQYWLGVMYFDGSGITDDRDEAIHWIALSSDQNYPPAQKLLHHLLVTEEVLDC
ncbi:MAG: tetratricopeptide repeat protein [Cocleimonas sp.]